MLEKKQAVASERKKNHAYLGQSERMKLSLSIFITYSSAQRCEDFTLGQRCQSSCDGTFNNCKDACDNGDFS